MTKEDGKYIKKNLKDLENMNKTTFNHLHALQLIKRN